VSFHTERITYIEGVCAQDAKEHIWPDETAEATGDYEEKCIIRDIKIFILNQMLIPMRSLDFSI
jgi:hypothetical protein